MLANLFGLFPPRPFLFSLFPLPFFLPPPCSLPSFWYIVLAPSRALSLTTYMGARGRVVRHAHTVYPAWSSYIVSMGQHRITILRFLNRDLKKKKKDLLCILGGQTLWPIILKGKHISWPSHLARCPQKEGLLTAMGHRIHSLSL